jgi:HJR/Mrr/RecB family endonuclease
MLQQAAAQAPLRMLTWIEFLRVLDRLADSTTILDSFSPGEFEGFVAHLFGALGYEVEPEYRRLRSVDSIHRPDIIVRIKPDGFMATIGAIECKKTRRVVGESVVEQAWRMVQDGVADWAAVLTTSTFSDAARQFAMTSDGRVNLFDRNALWRLAMQARQQMEDRAGGIAFRFGQLELTDLDQLDLSHYSGQELSVAAHKLALPEEFQDRLIQVEQIPLRVIDMILRDERHLYQLAPRAFEEFVAEMINRLGFKNVLLTPRSRDGGKDVVASKLVHGIPITFFFECKKYAKTKQGAIRYAQGVARNRCSRFPRGKHWRAGHNLNLHQRFQGTHRQRVSIGREGLPRIARLD